MQPNQPPTLAMRGLQRGRDVDVEVIKGNSVLHRPGDVHHLHNSKSTTLKKDGRDWEDKGRANCGSWPTLFAYVQSIADHQMLRRAASSAWQRRAAVRSFSSNMYPPANAARGATADLCDVFVPDPVDQITQPTVQIAQPIFRCAVLRETAALALALAIPDPPSSSAGTSGATLDSAALWPPSNASRTTPSCGKR